MSTTVKDARDAIARAGQALQEWGGAIDADAAAQSERAAKRDADAKAEIERAADPARQTTAERAAFLRGKGIA